jgi:hypothetical protein
MEGGEGARWAIVASFQPVCIHRSENMSVLLPVVPFREESATLKWASRKGIHLDGTLQMFPCDKYTGNVAIVKSEN